jgi:hypothetical protein
MSASESPENRVVVRSEVLGNARRDPPHPSMPSRPTALLLAGLAAGAFLAAVAGIALGGSFIIPVVVFMAAVLALFGIQRALALMATRRYGDRAADATAEDADDPIPGIGFDEDTALGTSDQQTPVEDR